MTDAQKAKNEERLGLQKPAARRGRGPQLQQPCTEVGTLNTRMLKS